MEKREPNLGEAGVRTGRLPRQNILPPARWRRRPSLHVPEVESPGSSMSRAPGAACEAPRVCVSRQAGVAKTAKPV